MWLSEYLAQFHQNQTFAIPSLDGADANADGRASQRSHGRGVAVLVANQDEMSFFVVQQVGGVLSFLHTPEQYVVDVHNASSSSSSSPLGGEETFASRKAQALDATAALMWQRIQQCDAFRLALTWWYRVEPLAGDALKRMLIATHHNLHQQQQQQKQSCRETSHHHNGTGETVKVGGADEESPRNTTVSCPPSINWLTLEDPRWCLLPREKLMKNGKFSLKPESLANQMQYGLLEMKEAVAGAM